MYNIPILTRKNKNTHQSNILKKQSCKTMKNLAQICKSIVEYQNYQSSKINNKQKANILKNQAKNMNLMAIKN